MLVLEARERIGGRAYTKPFLDDPDGPHLEYGGAWITPWQTRIRSLVERHGLTLRPRIDVTERLYVREDGPHRVPAAEADRPAYDRALARISADAVLLKHGITNDEKGRPLSGISYDAYLDRIGTPAAVRNQFDAWWTVSGNGDPGRVAASEFLASCVYGEGPPEAMIDVWADTVVPGMAVLAERMLDAAGARVRLSVPVSRVSQTDGAVQITVTDDSVLTADAVVVAIGINQLSAMTFDPPLPAKKAHAVSAGHGGRAFKIWARVNGVALGTLTTGTPDGLQLAFAERDAGDGAVMVVGFGVTDASTRLDDPEWRAGQIRKLMPNADVVASDTHDWVDDPFARGTWVAAFAGQEDGLDPDVWRPEGRIVFASSDIAREQAGWFEAAIISGEDAAADVRDLLAANKEH